MSVNLAVSRVRRATVAIIVLALAACLSLTTIRGLRAGAALAAGPSAALEPAGETRNRPLEGLTAREVSAVPASRFDLGGVRNGVVMVFDTACGPCAVNMGNWADVVREARGRPVALLALTVEPGYGAAEYWSGWAGVRVLAGDTATLRNDLRLHATPTTLIVEDGVVRKAYVGPLGPVAKAELVQWIQSE